jgi:ribosomal protein S27E
LTRFGLGGKRFHDEEEEDEEDDGFYEVECPGCGEETMWTRTF